MKIRLTPRCSAISSPLSTRAVRAPTPPAVVVVVVVVAAAAVAAAEEAAEEAVVVAAGKPDPTIRAANTNHFVDAALKDAMSWLADTVCRHDPRLNRSDAICPCLSDAIAADRLDVSVLQLPGGDYYKKKAAGRKALLLARRHLEKLTESGQSSALDCRIISVMGLEALEVRAFMNELYGELRGQFLRTGYMFGAFHIYNRRHSRLNRDFFPMQTKRPMFAIRRLTRADERNLKLEPEYYEIFKEFYKL